VEKADRTCVYFKLEFHLQYNLQQRSVCTVSYDVTRWIPHQFSDVAFVIIGAAACVDVE
jgi:hypothetical protein